MANYPTSDPSFTTKNTGDTILASHINAHQDETVAIGSALRGTLQHAVTVGTGGLTVSSGGLTVSTGNTTLGQNFSVAGASTFAGAVTLSSVVTLASTSITLSGGNLAFPAAQSASAGANTLDDYEEGTWTPTLIGTAGAGQTYTTQTGRYVKVGKKVYVQGQIIMSGLGTASGNASISGLPFTIENTAGSFTGTLHIGYWASLTNAYVYLSMICINNTTRADLYGAGAAATALSQVAIADLAATTNLIFSGTYVASA